MRIVNRKTFLAMSEGAFNTKALKALRRQIWLRQ